MPATADSPPTAAPRGPAPLPQTPRAAGLNMPAEWAPHECCWMAWPSRASQWVDGLDRAQHAYAAIAQAIRRFEPVRMIAEPDAAAEARARCGPGIDVVVLPIDSPWTRDSGPTFLTSAAGRQAGTAWRFNAWGGKVAEYAQDATLAARVLSLAGAACYSSSLCLEGGALHSDGEGTIITTESVVLNPNRNPGIDRTAAEHELCNALGARTIVWLPGDPDGLHVDITDGHIDGMMCFVRPGVVLFESDPSATGAARELAAANRRALELAVDAAGRRLQIVSIDDAYDVETSHELFCRSYVNFYIANGGIVMPAYGTAGDARARAVIQACFPGRDVVQIDVTGVASGGGGIHCITQQQPVIPAC